MENNERIQLWLNHVDDEVSLQLFSNLNWISKIFLFLENKVTR